MYLDFNEYQELGGTLDFTAFLNYEFEAEAIINWYTFNRLENMELQPVPEKLKMCMFRLVALAELEASIYQGVAGSTADGWSGSIASQSNDGVSISYNTMSASEAFSALTSKSKGNVVEGVVRQYLSGLKDAKGRNLLYRGVYEDE